MAFLIVDVQRPHRREKLAALLWPEMPDESARNNLRQALSNLRKRINDARVTPSFLLVDRQSVQWNSDSCARVDVQDFTRAVGLLPADDVNLSEISGAVNAYRGEFLEGFNLLDNTFGDWLLATQENYTRQAVNMMSAMATYYENNRDFFGALPYAWRLVELNPLDEVGQRQLLRLLTVAGQRNTAIVQYEKLAKELRETLAIFPEKATSDLYEKIKNGRLIEDLS